MNQEPLSLEKIRELNLYRRLLAIAGAVYLLWWFAVHGLFPQAFNPLLSRVSVVAYLWGVLGLSFVGGWMQPRIRFFFLIGMWLITAHYYYLFYGNAADLNWIMGAYITVIAISFGIFSNGALLSYSLYVVALSAGLVWLVPDLGHSVFLPGLLTLLIQSNVGLRSRMSLIKSLQASNERFQMLFNSTFEGVFVDQDGRIVNVNEALVRMLGYSREELIGAEAQQLLHPEFRQQSIDKMRQIPMEPYETMALTKNGSAIDVEVRGKNFNYGKSPARLVTVQNISDRKSAERDRVIALTLAENVRIRDDFISIASHELKTPLSSLQLQLQLIDRDLKKEGSDQNLPDKMRKASEFLKRQILRLTELVETMLDVSRISAGRFTLSLEKVNFSHVVAEAVSHHTALSPDKRSLIQLEAADPTWVSGDHRRLEQLVENLLSNAIKYGNNRPVLLRVTGSNTLVTLTVEDEGLGIPPDYLDRIFERFERALSARNITGFGLGLYISREIVRAHGGTIAVQSQPGVGSKFTVTLPALF